MVFPILSQINSIQFNSEYPTAFLNYILILFSTIHEGLQNHFLIYYFKYFALYLRLFFKKLNKNFLGDRD